MPGLVQACPGHPGNSGGSTEVPSPQARLGER